ncbi:hypothetical protein ACIBCT_21435 [Streptosporangium sp. NPDC050855]|uniref:hypothetical protein n=1 Tax=Streptosporangium sp. NPDC050855 TaxID=3366194 RepID=UPI0037BCD28C
MSENTAESATSLAEALAAQQDLEAFLASRRRAADDLVDFLLERPSLLTVQLPPVPEETP